MQVEDIPIRIPDGAHWRDVREVTENVGNKLVEAFIAIEQANPAKEMDGRKSEDWREFLVQRMVGPTRRRCPIVSLLR